MWINDLKIENTNVFWNPVSVLDCLNKVPRLKQWFLEQKLMVKSIALTVGTSLDCCGPHKDTPPARFKLSWPIINTKTTWNRFFNPKIGSQYLRINHLGGEIWSYHDIEEIERVRVEFPMLIDAGTIHDVFCEPGTVFPRLGLQMQLLNEPISL